MEKKRYAKKKEREEEDRKGGVERERKREGEREKEGERERGRERETELCPYSWLPSVEVILPSGYLPRQPGWPTLST